MLHLSPGRWAALLSAAAFAAVLIAGPTLSGPASGPPQTEKTMVSSSNQPAPLPDTPDASDASGLPAPEPPTPLYDFTQPVPESPPVDNSYFQDAAFVGDSRTDGFLIYSGIGCGKNLTSNGLSIFKLAEKKALTINGETYTLLEALALEQYGKVYLSLGVNELGYRDDEGFYQSYVDAIRTIRSLQPNAVLYIQGLIPLNEQMIAQSGGRDYNDLMRRAAQEEQAVFLDLYPVFANEDGQLPAEASKDGVHLKSDWCKQWLAYLQTHTVDFETLYPAGVQTDCPASGTEGVPAT